MEYPEAGLTQLRKMFYGKGSVISMWVPDVANKLGQQQFSMSDADFKGIRIIPKWQSSNMMSVSDKYIYSQRKGAASPMLLL